MRHRAVLAVAAGLLAAGCGVQRAQAPAPPAVADASRVDMCAMLTDAELTGLGVRLDSRKQINQSGVVGCRWQGKPFTLSLARDNDTVAGYRARRNDPGILSFADNTVNGRAGAHLGVDRRGSQCAQLIDGGPVSLSVSVALAANQAGTRPIDPCTEALRIAQRIEPRLPTVGS
ncbi:MAG TPA: DUF3558 family protein [Pseudonocardiaceae bacterium]